MLRYREFITRNLRQNGISRVFLWLISTLLENQIHGSIMLDIRVIFSLRTKVLLPIHSTQTSELRHAIDS